MSNTNMTNTEKLEAIRNIATEMLNLIDSDPLAQPMAWMTASTPEDHASTIAGHCAKLACEVINIALNLA